MALKISVSPSSITDWIKNGNTPKADVLAKMSTNLGINGNWLLTGSGPIFLEDSKKIEGDIISFYLKNYSWKFITIPIIPADCGNLKTEDSKIFDFIELDKSSLQFDIQDIIIYRAIGSNMEPAIFDNDLLFVSKSIKWKENDIVIYKIKDTKICRRVTVFDRKTYLINDNLISNDDKIPLGDGTFIGVVKRIEREL